MIFLIFKTFVNWQEPVPIAAYNTIIKAHQECDKLNTQRSDAEVESGLFYYVREQGVPLYV